MKRPPARPTKTQVRNPYAPLHKKLVDFADNAELDPELVARNEFLRLENLLLRGTFPSHRGQSKKQVEQAAMSSGFKLPPRAS